MTQWKWWLRHRLLGDPVQAAKDIYWWIVHRTTRRYHVVKLQYLKPGYWHGSTRILHALFSILIEYMETQEYKEVDWDATPEHKHANEEMIALRKWWIEEFPARKDPIFDVPDSELPPFVDLNKTQELYPVYHEACQQSNELEKRWYEEDHRNVMRLMEVYRCM